MLLLSLFISSALLLSGQSFGNVIAGSQNEEVDTSVCTNGYCPLSNRLIALNSTEGFSLFMDGRPHSFFQLIQNFHTQENTVTCGLASMITILNSMHIEKPKTKAFCPKDPKTCYKYFTEQFLAEDLPCSKAIVHQYPDEDGLDLDQVRDILKNCIGLETQVFYAGKTSHEDFLKAFHYAFVPGSFLIANYGRQWVYQAGLGHFSPIAAYNVEKDRVLILDTSRYKYPSVWVRTRDMINAMNTSSSLGNPRGLLLVHGKSYSEVKYLPSSAIATSHHDFLTVCSASFMVTLANW